MVDIRLDISGIAVPEDVRRAITKAIANKTPVALRSKHKVVYIDVRNMKTYNLFTDYTSMYYKGKLTITQADNVQQFYELIKLLLVTCREVLPSLELSTLMAYIAKRLIEQRKQLDNEE